MAHPQPEPPAQFRAEAERAMRFGGVLVIAGVQLTPPSLNRRYWRVVACSEGQRFEHFYGPEYSDGYRGYLHARSWIAGRSAAQRRRPSLEDTPLAEFIDSYIARRGKDGSWSDKTLCIRSADLHGLREIAVNAGLRCADLNLSHVRDHLGRVARERSIAAIMGVTRTMLAFGLQCGYFSREQVEFVNAVARQP